ncbi:GntR family transcriptional regulator [Bordetella pertussis]
MRPGRRHGRAGQRQVARQRAQRRRLPAQGLRMRGGAARIRAEMEGVCTRMACQRMTAEERSELARVHREAAPVVQADDAQAWRKANHRFHEVLYRGCRNPYLREQLLALRARTGAYLRHAFIAVGRVRASYEQHGELVQAILDHDPERAHRMMMRHISLAQGAKGLADFLINLPRSMVKP